MGDPIKDLHARMAQADLLNDENKDYNSFVKNIGAPGAKEKLYEVLKSSGEVKSDFAAFDSFFFSKYEDTLAQVALSEKKNLGGSVSSDGSSGIQPAAPTVADGSKSAIDTPDDKLTDDIKNSRGLGDMIPLVASESTGVATPMKKMPDLTIRADMDPVQEGAALIRQKEEDFDYKERRAGRSEFRTAERSIKKIEEFSDKADRQSRFADFHMKEKYGQDWLDQVKQLQQDLDPEYMSRNRENIDPAEVIEKQAKLNNMLQDPMFDTFMQGVGAQQNAYKAYKSAVATPEYARYIADIEKSREAADESVLFKGASFLGQVTGPVVTGIASLPRTLLSAIGAKEVPVVDDLADWADEQTRFIQSKTSLGSVADRPLWSSMAEYKGMQVEVDDSGRPVAAYRNGKMVDMEKADVEEFISSGVANNARNSFTGWENAGFATAKTLANLYLMRNLGGGTSIGTGATSFVISYNDLYNEALNDFGYSATEAAQYAIANAGVQAAAEATFGKIDVSPINLQSARAFGMREAKALLGKQSAFEVGKNAGKAIIREVIGENKEELAQMASDNIITALFNAKSGGSIERDISAQDVAETILLTTATTLIASGGDSGRLGARSEYNNSLIAAAENPEGIAPVLEQMIASGHLDASRAPVIAARLEAVAAVNATLPKSMPMEERSQVLALELKKAVLNESVTPETPDNQKAYVKEAVKVVDEQIEQVKNPPQPTEEGNAPAETVEIPQDNEGVQDVKKSDIAEDVVMEDAPMPSDGPFSPDGDVEMARVNFEEPSSVVQEQGTPAIEEQAPSDFTDLLSDSVRPFVDQADRNNLNEWVQANLADPDEVGNFNSTDEAARAFAREYEDTMLMPKYARQIKDAKKGVPLEAETNANVSTQSADIPIQAHDIVTSMPESEQEAAVQALTPYMTELGDMNIDRLEADVASGAVQVPESIKTLLDEKATKTNIPNSSVQDQRTENRAEPVSGSPAQVRQPSTGRTAVESERANVAPAGPQAPASPEVEIDQQLAEAPLPNLDNDVLMEMVDDGLITTEQYNQATAYLYGKDKSAAAVQGYEEAMAARDGLRKVKERTTLSSKGGMIIQRRSDGVVEVYGHTGDAESLLAAGATYNPIQDRYEATPENEVAVLEALTANDVDQAPAPYVPVDGADEALSTPEAKAEAKKRNAKYKGATSFQDRLDAAMAAHGSRRSVTEKSAVQKVLGKLTKSMPGVKVNTNPRDFATKLKEAADSKGVKFDFKDGLPSLQIDGQWISPPAMEIDGEVFINTDIAHIDAPIHEFGHLWNAWLRQNNPDEYQKGSALVKDSPYLEAVKQNPLYADLDEEAQVDEALSQAIGDRGRMMLDMTPFVKFRNWAADMWRSVEGAFGRPRMQSMTLQQWADAQARTLLSEQRTTGIDSRSIAGEEYRQGQARKAAAMERLGVPAQQIEAATGAKRAVTGEWQVRPIPVKARFDGNASLSQNTTARALLDAPKVFSAFPDFDYPVRLDPDNRKPYIRDGKLVMAPIVDAKYLAKVVDTLQTVLPVPSEARTNVKFMAQQPVRTKAVPGTIDHATRMLSAAQIIKAEMQSEGMKDYESKSRRLADALGLRFEDVMLAWEQEADAAKHGRLVMSLGDAKTSGKGKWAQLVESIDIRNSIAAEKISEFLQRYFTVKGLFPPEIKLLAEQRGYKIAGRMTEVRYALKDLEKAMKADYGKPDEIHYRLVDNVMRGEADWKILPENVREAAINIRNLTDALSQELITSGATNGRMVLTILNNSGVAATAENMLNWNGVNLFEALDKLPFERSDAEHEAIRTFLKKHNTMLGSYFYRSYRKHKDKDWAKKVPPRVLADAREFIKKDLLDRIIQIEAARDESFEDLQQQIEAIDLKRLNHLATIRINLSEANKRVQDLAAAQNTYIHQKGAPNQSLQSQQKKAMEKADKWMNAVKDAYTISGLDIDVMMSLTSVDLSAFAFEARKIVKMRQDQRALEERQQDAMSYRKGEHENLRRMVHTKPGDFGGIDGIIASILHTEDIGGPMPAASLGTKQLSFLRKRQDIPTPIRDLMGEYHDARVNFVESAARMINVIEDQVLLSTLRDQYEGTFFFPPEAEDMGVPLSSIGSISKDPLNGWRTTPQIKKAMDDYFRDRYDFPAVVSGLRYISDWVKYGKTILSPITHFRNFFSNLYFVFQNGYLPKHFVKSWDAFRNAWDIKTNDEHRAYITKLTSLGVIGSGAASGDIKAVIDRVNSDAIKNLQGGTKWTQFMRWTQKTYAAEDDFFRIMSFESEKSRYAKAYYSKSFDQLSPEQQSDVEMHAAELVNETMPTYSKVPEAVTFLREVPLFGTFVAFPAEMFRISYNQIKRVGIEMNDPRTRGIAFGRMIGMGIAQGLPLAAVSLMRHIMGVSAEEEKSARYFTPEWQQDSMWLWDGFKPGEQISFKNLGYSDPYAFYKRPIIRMMSGPARTMEENAADAAYSLVSPFLDVELTTGTILALAYNKNPQSGKDIYNPGAGILGDWRSFGEFAIKQLQPGGVKFGYDVASVFTGEGQFGKPPKDWDDIVLNLVGLATEKTDLPQSARFRAKSVRQQVDYARQYFHQNKWKYKNDKAGLLEMYERTTDQYNEGIKELSLLISNGQKVGIPSRQLLGIIKEEHFSKDEIRAAVTGIRIYPKFQGINK